MAPHLDWNDLRHLIAVAESGSTLAAARQLGVSQTTSARRVAALEAALGVTLFERSPTGYRLTPEGLSLIDRAQAVSAAVDALDAAATSLARASSGTVRLTALEIEALTILPPILRDLHLAYPDIRIELDTSDQIRDLASGEADIALRMADRPSGQGLVARRLVDNPWSIYCSRDYAERRGWPTRRRELGGHSFIGGGDPRVWSIYEQWLRDNGLESAVAMRHDTALGVLSAVRAGMGLAVLPCLVADQDPELVQCLPPQPGRNYGLWLLTHERLRRVPRIRIVLEFLAERLGALARHTALTEIGSSNPEKR